MIPICIAAALVATAAVDCRSKRIPNWLSLFIFCAGGVFRYGNWGAPGVVSGIEGAMLGGAAAMLPYILLGLGGGDVKLIAASGMFLGPTMLAVAAFHGACTAVATAVLALTASPRLAGRRAAWRRWLRRDSTELPMPMPGDTSAASMPLAPAWSIGVLLAALEAGYYGGA